MKIHGATGTRTYSTAQEAQREQRKHGFPVEEPDSTEEENYAEKRILEWLRSQQAAGSQDTGRASARRARAKLQEFFREDEET